VALLVPSAAIRGEWNVLLNPVHREFSKIAIYEPRCLSSMHGCSGEQKRRVTRYNCGTFTNNCCCTRCRISRSRSRYRWWSSRFHVKAPARRPVQGREGGGSIETSSPFCWLNSMLKTKLPV
jgi:hypothetical protein